MYIKKIAEILQELFDRGLSEVKLSKGQVNWLHDMIDCMGFDDDPFYMPLFAELKKGNVISDPNALEALYFKAEMYTDMYGFGDKDAEALRDKGFGDRILAKFYKGAEAGNGPEHEDWINSDYYKAREKAEAEHFKAKRERLQNIV